MIEVLLTDLDGVLRHFDAARMQRLERDHDLAPGIFARTAFAPELLRPMVTGQISRAQWVDRIAQQVGAPARIWLEDRGTIDSDVWRVLRGMAEHVAIGVLTNGTDETLEELSAAGLLTSFDHVFVSAELGVAKPDAELYAHVTAALGVEPGAVAFVDDADENVKAARMAGWHAHRFEDVVGLESWLDELRK